MEKTVTQEDVQLAKDVAALAESPEFKALRDKVQSFYDPLRQRETLHGALRVILVTMDALAPKTVTALKEAEAAVKAIEAAEAADAA